MTLPTKAMALKLLMDEPLTRIMTADVITTRPDAGILECIRQIETMEISAMPIVKDDKVLGVISGDIWIAGIKYGVPQI